MALTRTNSLGKAQPSKGLPVKGQSVEVAIGGTKCCWDDPAPNNLATRRPTPEAPPLPMQSSAILTPPGAPQDAPLGSSRRHYRPEESPADVDSLEKLNPSLVTIVPDFSFSPPKGILGSKSDKRASRRHGRAPSPLRATAAAAEGAGESAKAERRVRVEPAVDESADWRPSSKPASVVPGSQSARLRPEGLVAVEAKAVVKSEPASKSDRLSPLKTRPSQARAPSPLKPHVPEEPSQSEVAVRASRAPSPLRSSASGAMVAPLRTRRGQALEQRSQLEPLPFLPVFGKVLDEAVFRSGGNPRARGSPSASPAAADVAAARRQAGLGSPNGSPSCRDAQASQASRSLASPKAATNHAVATGGQRDASAGSAVPLRAHAESTVPQSCTSLEKGAMATGVLKNPRLRALAKEDRTSSFGSGTFVVEDFLSNLVPETPRVA